MRLETERICTALLEHHRSACQPVEDRFPAYTRCLIAYGDLCERAAVGYLTRTVAIFLQEIAAWCHEKGWPPLNALAVNAETRQPGDGYNSAPGRSLLNWPAQAQAAVEFTGYPQAPP